jgi:hypothetical protein
VAALYAELFKAAKTVLETPSLLAELVRLVRGETHHARILSHEVDDMRKACVGALAVLAARKNSLDRETRAVLKVLFSESHPLTNPDNLARAVALGSPEFADEVLRAGYEQAAQSIGKHLETLVVQGVNEDICDLYRRRMWTIFVAPGLIVAHERPRPSPEALNAAGYETGFKLVYVPVYRSMSDQKLLHLSEQLSHITHISPCPRPESIAANKVAAAIITAVLGNRYTFVAYAAADVLADGGPMTVFGPSKKPLIDRNGSTENLTQVLDIVEQYFKSAGRKVKKQFLENYFRKIRYVVGLGEELTGARLDAYDLRGYYEAAGEEPLEKVRQNVRAFLKGGGVEDFEMKTMDPLSPLEQLHLYLGITPYLTRHQLKLLESVAASILTLTIKPPKTGKDRMEYMRLKRKQAAEAAKALTWRTVPVYAYTPVGGPKGLDRVSWALMTRLATPVADVGQ